MVLQSKNKNAGKKAVKETAVEETAVKETPVEETPVEETAVEETAVEETAVEETPVEETPVEETATADLPAVKYKATGAVAANSLKPTDFMKAYKDALPPVEFGTLPRIKASNGIFMDDENNELGKNITFTLVSFNDNWAITPNVNDQSANKYCKFSYNGVTINDGSETSVVDYMEFLKDEGFEKPSKKRYLEVTAILDDADEDSDIIGEMVQLNLSPQSVKKFDAYNLQTMVKVARGMMTAEQAGVITARAKIKTFNTFTFTLFTFKPANT